MKQIDLVKPAIKELFTAWKLNKLAHPVLSPHYPHPFVWDKQGNYYSLPWIEGCSAYCSENLNELASFHGLEVSEQVVHLPKAGTPIALLFFPWLSSWIEILRNLKAKYFGFRFQSLSSTDFYLLDLENVDKLFVHSIPSEVYHDENYFIVSFNSHDTFEALIEDAVSGEAPKQNPIKRLINSNFLEAVESKLPSPRDIRLQEVALLTKAKESEAIVPLMCEALAHASANSTILNNMDIMLSNGQLEDHHKAVLVARLSRFTATTGTGKIVFSYIPRCDETANVYSSEDARDLVSRIAKQFIPLSIRAGLTEFTVSTPIIEDQRVKGTIISGYKYDRKTKTIDWELDVLSTSPSPMQPSDVDLEDDSMNRTIIKLFGSDEILEDSHTLVQQAKSMSNPVNEFHALHVGRANKDYIQAYSDKHYFFYLLQFDPIYSSPLQMLYKKRLYELIYRTLGE